MENYGWATRPPSCRNGNYLHSTSHLGRSSATVVSSLIERALHALILDPSYFCTSLVEWKRKMELDLAQALHTPISSALLSFIGRAVTTAPRSAYTDGSFAVNSTLIASLATPSAKLVHEHSLGCIYPRRMGLALYHYSSEHRRSMPRMPTTKSFWERLSRCCWPKQPLLMPSPTARQLSNVRTRLRIL